MLATPAKKSGQPQCDSVRRPERIEYMPCAPIHQEAKQRTTNQSEGQQRFTNQEMPKDVPNSTACRASIARAVKSNFTNTGYPIGCTVRPRIAPTRTARRAAADALHRRRRWPRNWLQSPSVYIEVSSQARFSGCRIGHTNSGSPTTRPEALDVR